MPSVTTSYQIVYTYKHITNLFKGRYDVISNAATGQYHLVIKRAQLEDAGRYTCGDRDDTHHAELIVFRKQSNNVSSTLNNLMAIIIFGRCCKGQFRRGGLMSIRVLTVAFSFSHILL